MTTANNGRVTSTTTPDPAVADLLCSQWALDLAEPLAGTAGTARGHFAIEQSGAWGRNALSESNLNSDVASTIAEQTSNRGISAMLIRSPGRTADRDHREGRTVLAALNGDQPQLIMVTISELGEIEDLDWSAFDSGDLSRLHPRAQAVTTPMTLVCAHAKRDRCCALKGRPLASSLAERHPGSVWECSHLGGHRFAPTALMLPAGAVYGRLDEQVLEQAYQAAARGEVLPDYLRGLARYDRAIQAAEVAVRQAAGIVSIESPALLHSRREDRVTHTRFLDQTSRIWEVDVETMAVQNPRPESCGKEPGLPIFQQVIRCEVA